LAASTWFVMVQVASANTARDQSDHERDTWPATRHTLRGAAIQIAAMEMTWRGPLAVTNPARRTAPDLCRWTAFATPTVWWFATSAIKPVFQHGEHGEPRRTTEEPRVWRFARRPIEHRAQRHTGLLRGSSWFSVLSVLKNLLAFAIGTQDR
jgi:hypothetical protein